MKLFLTGGFLGSGKTTAIQQACTVLMEMDMKVAVITNDQGTQLVDGRFINSFGIPSTEVGNGCFCCQYQELNNSIVSLSAEHHPHIVFAESVGSCTDLVATVVKPLLQSLPNLQVTLSVFADAYLLYSLMNGNACFLDEQVQYIYKKQLEEADVIVVNKIDLLNEVQIQQVKEIIQSDYPDKIVVYQNSLEKENIQTWLQTLHAFPQNVHRNSLDLDYDRYGAGEAKLAWLDKEIYIEKEGSAFEVALALTDLIHQNISKHNYTIGHLKFFLDDGEQQHKISYTTNSLLPNKRPQFNNKKNTVSVLINARVQTEPAQLESIVAKSIEEIKAETGCHIVDKQTAVFKPGFPKPVNRILVPF